MGRPPKQRTGIPFHITLKMAQNNGEWIPHTPDLLRRTLEVVVRRIGKATAKGQREAQWIKHQLQCVTSLELDQGEVGLSEDEIQGCLQYLDNLSSSAPPPGEHLREVLRQQRADLLTYFSVYNYQGLASSSQLKWLGQHLDGIEAMLKAWHCLCFYRNALGSGLLNLRYEKFFPEFDEKQNGYVMPSISAVLILLAHLHGTTPANVQLLLKQRNPRRKKTRKLDDSD